MSAVLVDMKQPETEFSPPARGDSEFDRLMHGSVNQFMFNDSRMDRMLKTAEIMASGKTTVPAHLRGSVGDCMAIVLQAAQWDMNPFSVAQKTHLVNGLLGYEAQLVNAVIITRAPIKGRPRFEWDGDWSKINGKDSRDDALAVTVSATFVGDEHPVALRISMAQVGWVRNSPLWIADPRQQLAYLAIKRWARLYCPDVLLGVYSADELEDRTDAAPAAPDTPPPASRTDAVKSKLLARQQRDKIAESLAKAGAMQPDPLPPMDPETGEILDAPPTDTQPEDPIADLLLAISECQTREELEQHREAVVALKNGMKRRAADAWKAVEKRLTP